MTVKRLYTIEELESYAPYTPFVGYAMSDALQVLFQRSPNGAWWIAGDSKPIKAAYLVNLCRNGILPLSIPESVDSGEWKLTDELG